MNDVQNLVNPDIFWKNLLSREPSLIQSIYSKLDSSSKKAIKKHLQRMVTELDWHAEQVKSARIALEVIQKINTKKEIH